MLELGFAYDFICALRPMYHIGQARKRVSFWMPCVSTLEGGLRMSLICLLIEHDHAVGKPIEFALLSPTALNDDIGRFRTSVLVSCFYLHHAAAATAAAAASHLPPSSIGASGTCMMCETTGQIIGIGRPVLVRKQSSLQPGWRRSGSK